MVPLHRVIAIESKAPDTYKLVLKRNDFNFRAGQCFNLGMPGTGVNREYSSYSAESSPELAFLIREVEGGCVSPLLRKIKPGDEVEVDGAYGEFCIRNPNDQSEYYFIATGTGIAPFHCFVKSFPQLRYQIIHGVRHASEQYDATEYGSRYLGCISREDGGTFRGRVTDYLQPQALNPKGMYYLCGNRAMINEVYDLLRAKGVSGSQIFTETFF